MVRPYLAALVILLSACSKKAPECEALRKAIIPTAERVEGASEKADKVEAWTGVAEASDDAVARVGRLRLTVSDLKKLAAEYQGVQREFAANAREIADAWAVVQGAKQRQQKTADDLGAVVVKHVIACSHAAEPKDKAGCQRFQAGIKTYLDAASKTDEVQRITADLQKIPFESEEVKAAAEAVVHAARLSNLVLLDLESALARATAADARISAAEEKEHDLFGRIDELCK